MTEETKIILDEIRGLKVEMVSMKDNFYSLEKKIDSLDKRVGSLEEKVDSLDKRVGSLEEKVDSLDKRVGSLEENASSLNMRIGALEKEIKEIRLTQENEVIHGIRIVAEGHADLNRKLDEALQVTNEKEIMLLRLNSLESEVRRLKDKLATIA